MKVPETIRSGGRNLFLKWALLNAVGVVFLAGLGVAYGGRIHGPSLVAIPIILGMYVFAQINGARVCWNAGGEHVDETPVRARLLHETQWLGHWAYNAQLTGILSTVAGFWLILSTGGSDQALHDRILSGGGVALVGTFVGVFASKLLVHTARMIEHDLGE